MPTLSKIWVLMGVIVLMLQAAGCSETVTHLKAQGVEFDSGKVVRIYRF